jgi:AcrR family transcriptional regulator
MVNKEEYRLKIIFTASRIFSRHGFKNTTMDEISRALKKGKSSIYYYYGSKEEIFEAVVKYEANQGSGFSGRQASQLYLREDEGF